MTKQTILIRNEKCGINRSILHSCCKLPEARNYLEKLRFDGTIKYLDTAHSQLTTSGFDVMWIVDVIM